MNKIAALLTFVFLSVAACGSVEPGPGPGPGPVESKTSASTTTCSGATPAFSMDVYPLANFGGGCTRLTPFTFYLNRDALTIGSFVTGYDAFPLFFSDYNLQGLQYQYFPYQSVSHVDSNVIGSHSFAIQPVGTGTYGDLQVCNQGMSPGPRQIFFYSYFSYEGVCWSMAAPAGTAVWFANPGYYGWTGYGYGIGSIRVGSALNGYIWAANAPFQLPQILTAGMNYPNTLGALYNYVNPLVQLYIY